MTVRLTKLGQLHTNGVLSDDEFTAAKAVLALLVVAATLESVFALCLGCKAFAVLMRLGVIPEEVCERCNNIWST